MGFPARLGHCRTLGGSAGEGVKMMMRTLNAIGDKLLAMVVPRTTAKADCGEYYEWCYCVGRYAYHKFCCASTGSCGSCYNYGQCPT
jgi:hypothetical protein